MTHTLRCYEISDLFRTAMERAVDPETGELTDSGVAEIRALTATSHHSAADLACMVREIELEADAINNAMKYMSERAQRLNNRAQKWRGYLIDTLDCMGSNAIRDARITVAIRTNPSSVRIIDNADIPLGYCREIPGRTEPDKTALKAALKAGEIIPGVELVVTRRVVIQ